MKSNLARTTRKVRWVVTHPNGIKKDRVTTSLRIWCEKNDIKYTCLSNEQRKGEKHYKGFMFERM